MAENGSREDLLAGLRVFVQYFPSEIPLHLCCSLIASHGFTMMIVFTWQTFNLDPPDARICLMSCTLFGLDYAVSYWL